MNINMKFNEGMRRSRCSRIQFTLSIENLILQKLRECLFSFYKCWYNLFYDVECQFFQERTLIVCPSVVIPVSAIFIISTRGKSCLRENTNWVTNVTKKNNVFKDLAKGFTQLFLKHTVSLRYWDLYHNLDLPHGNFD